MAAKKSAKPAPRKRERAPEKDDREERPSRDRDRDRDSGRDRDDRDRDRDRGDDRGDRGRGSSREGNSDFVNITKLFETKKNPDNLVGTCKPEYLAKLQELLDEAKDQDKGVSFFVFTAGKWGASLAATLAKDQGGSFNDGNRGGRGRSRGRY